MAHAIVTIQTSSSANRHPIAMLPTIVNGSPIYRNEANRKLCIDRTDDLREPRLVFRFAALTVYGKNQAKAMGFMRRGKE